MRRCSNLIADLDLFFPVQFLIDTGADVTVISPQDSRLLFRDASIAAKVRSWPQTRMGGAGSGVSYYRVDATVSFVHANGAVEPVAAQLHVGEPDERINSLESLLGRDVLRHFVTTFDGLDAVTLEPK